jgi:hypothetical protein
MRHNEQRLIPLAPREQVTETLSPADNVPTSSGIDL